MAKRLPHRVTTASGNQFDINFPLHPNTVSPVQVSQMLCALLEALDREINVLGDVGNGDVLQALAMAIKARAAMVQADPEMINSLCEELVITALGAQVIPGDDNLPDEPREVH